MDLWLWRITKNTTATKMDGRPTVMTFALRSAYTARITTYKTTKQSNTMSIAHKMEGERDRINVVIEREWEMRS